MGTGTAGGERKVEGGIKIMMKGSDEDWKEWIGRVQGCYEFAETDFLAY